VRTGQLSGSLRASASYLLTGSLAVAVCAGGFYLLYSALPRLGADRVGLFAGLVPFGAMGAALLLGAGTIGPDDVAGAVLVATGWPQARAPGKPGNGKRKIRRRRRSSAGRGRGHRVLSIHRADGGTARRGAAA
jgi:hypothetical protein